MFLDVYWRASFHFMFQSFNVLNGVHQSNCCCFHSTKAPLESMFSVSYGILSTKILQKSINHQCLLIVSFKNQQGKKIHGVKFAKKSEKFKFFRFQMTNGILLINEKRLTKSRSSTILCIKIRPGQNAQNTSKDTKFYHEPLFCHN